MTEWADAVRWGIAWGPGLIILAGIFKLLRQPPKFIGDFILVQQDLAVAMNKMANAVEKATQRDSAKLDELLVGQQLLLGRIEAFEGQLARREGSHGSD